MEGDPSQLQIIGQAVKVNTQVNKNIRWINF